MQDTDQNIGQTADPRDEVLKKSGGLCFYCGKPLDAKFHIDHYHPSSRGGSDSIDNLVPACGYCNNSKGNRTIEEWRNQVARRRYRESVDMPEFSKRQRDYLKTIGVDIYPQDLDAVQFWFEANPITVSA